MIAALRHGSLLAVGLAPATDGMANTLFAVADRAIVSVVPCGSGPGRIRRPGGSAVLVGAAMSCAV